MNQDYKNIIVFCLRKIGDAVIATSVAYLLKKAYPNAQITMLVRPLTQEIVTNNPVVDEVMLYNYTHKSTFTEMRQIAAKIKEKRFDLCIVADNKPRSAMIAWLSGIPKRVGFESLDFRSIYLKLFYTDIIKIDYDDMSTRQVTNHEIFINRFTGRNDQAKMVMAEAGCESKAKIDRLVEDAITEHNRTNPSKIVLCLRSGCLTKDWPINRFVEVVNRLSLKYNAVFYVIGSAADAELAHEFKRQVKAVVRVLCGQTSLAELAYLLTKSDLFLTVDTGSAHIAATTGVPMVTVFGSTSPKKWGPYTDKVICLSPDYACHPCDGTKIKCINPKCLETIQIEDVVEAGIVQLETHKDKRK